MLSIRLILAAGIGIVDALKSASNMVDSPLIGGQLDVSQALASTGVFPDYLIQFWATGEKSGRMDEMLDRLAKFYEDAGATSLDQTVICLPRIAYGLVMLYMVWQIFGIATTHFNSYNTILENRSSPGWDVL